VPSSSLKPYNPSQISPTRRHLVMHAQCNLITAKLHLQIQRKLPPNCIRTCEHVAPQTLDQKIQNTSHIDEMYTKRLAVPQSPCATSRNFHKSQFGALSSYFQIISILSILSPPEAFVTVIKMQAARKLQTRMIRSHKELSKTQQAQKTSQSPSSGTFPNKTEARARKGKP